MTEELKQLYRSIGMDDVEFQQLDEEHRKVLQFLSELESWVVSLFRERIRTVLSGYLFDHFSHERRLMQDHLYPKEEDHFINHTEVQSEVVRLARELATSKAVAHQFRAIIVWHIKDFDVPLVQFLKKKKE